MFEESITSSPSKSTKIVQKGRFLMQNNCKNVKACEKGDRHKNTDLYKIIYDFYKDSDDEDVLSENKSHISNTALRKPLPIVNDFKPFQLETSFVIADHVSSGQIVSNKSVSFAESQGFSTCQSLAKKDDYSFFITESELVNCCYQAEQALSDITQKGQENISLPQELTPSKLHVNTALVNSILDDFSQSPLTKEQMILSSSWQYTPEFRLRSKPTKTYSRKLFNKTRTNLSNRFDLQTPSVSDEDSGSCSSLSIQEDIAIVEKLSNPTVTSNTSQRLCQNLLNLSMYFTQNDQVDLEDGASQQDSNESTANYQQPLLSLKNIHDIIKEILTLRSMNPTLRSDSFHSDENFLGFPSKGDDIDVDSIDLEKSTGTCLDTTLKDPSCLNACQMEELDFLKSSKGEGNFTEWDDDDCQKMFANINTDEILALQNAEEPANHMFKLPNDDEIIEFSISKSRASINNPKLLASKNKNIEQNCTNFIEYKTEAQGIASILDTSSFKENSSNVNNCDNNAKKEINVFENFEENEWNDDNDLFINFQTPIDLEKGKPTQSNSNLHYNTNSVTCDQLYFQNNLAGSSNITNLGFQTAAGKTVHVSKKAEKFVERFLKDFTNELDEKYNYDDLKELKNRIFANTHSFKKGSNFTTISNVCEPVFMDDKGQCETIGDRLEVHNYKDCLRDQHTTPISFKVPSLGLQNPASDSEKFAGKDLKNLNIKIEESCNKLSKGSVANTLINKNDSYSCENNEIYNTNIDVNFRTSKVLNLEFQTASSKAIHISRQAQNSVKKLLEEFNSEVNENYKCNDLEEMKYNIYGKTHKKNYKPINNIMSIDDNTASNSYKGFYESNDKNICIQNAVISSENILNCESNNEFEKIKNGNELKNIFDNNVDFPDFECCLRKDTLVSDEINEEELKLLKLPIENSSLETKTSQTVIVNEKSLLKNCIGTTNIGFQTANGKKLCISTEAQEAVKYILQEFNGELDINTVANELNEIKSNLYHKKKYLKQTDNIKLKSNQEEHNENANMTLGSDCNLSSGKVEQKNITSKAISIKRKLSIDNSDTSTFASTTPSFAKLANKESSFTEHQNKSPLQLVSRSVISRKNLLSLTKSRKSRQNNMKNIDEDISKINKHNCETNINATTPKIKSSNFVGVGEQIQATPNSKEFFTNSPLTSTPRAESLHKLPHTFEDTDFKPIIWNCNNDSNVNKSLSSSNHTTKFLDTSSSNITINSSNPTVKERIGRLKMYGKAPAVSPILTDTNNSCRPSGLRRTRSMLKKAKK